MIPEFILTALLVFLRKEVLCLTDVVLDIEPTIVEKGHTATLKCNYNLEGNYLYGVKWFRENVEFYRYTANEKPRPYSIFGYRGVANMDFHNSNEYQVVLRNVDFNISGKFTCEVSTNSPSFYSIAASKDLLVVALPTTCPSISTDKSSYDVGDILKANCTSPASRPSASLTFILNNIMVYEKCVTKRNSSEELSQSKMSIKLPLLQSHFHDGRLTLECVAKIGDFYQQDAQVTFDIARDPVPARVTQSSANGLQSKTFLYGLIISSIVLK